MTLVYLAIAWLLGIYLGSWLHVPARLFIATSVCLAVATLALGRKPRARLLVACSLFLFLGLWRYDLARPTLSPCPLAAHNEQAAVTLRGLVANEPVPHDRISNLHLAVQAIQVGGAWTPITGQILVEAPSYESIRYGDELQVYGKLETPGGREPSSYGMFLARQGIHSVLRYPQITSLARDQGHPVWMLLYALRRRTQQVIRDSLPEPQAALLTGILVGSDEGIPRALMDDFRATGTAHIIAISGFNITLISAALVKVLSRLLQRYLALAVSIAIIVLYAILVGADPPVVRAAIMGGLSALALIVGRQSHALTSLCTAAWLMTAWQPFVLWDVGAQLSFFSCLGLIAYAQRLANASENLLRRFISRETAQRVVELLSGNLLSTVAAMITALPMMVYHFGSFTPASLLSNVLILPLQPAVMYLGATAALAGLVYLPLGRLVGWATWLFLTCTIRLVEITAQWVPPRETWSTPHPAILVAYAGALLWFTRHPPRALFSAAAWRRWLRRPVMRRASFSALVIAAILVWSAVASLPDGKLHVTFLDVGQGDAILVTTPSGRRLLIDGGPSPSSLLDALGGELPFWERRLDLILLTHPHDDHLRGLLTLPGRYEVGLVLLSGGEHDSGVYRQWQELLQNAGIPTLVVQQAWQVDFGDGPVMEVLPPDSAAFESLDETSLVSRLVWQQASFLFTGDLEAQGLLRLRDTGWPLSCTVLKVPHHGSNNSVTEELLSVARPSLAVISVGADNRFGHPTEQTLTRLEQAGIQVLRTDTSGTIEVTTDGDSYWVQTTGTP